MGAAALQRVSWEHPEGAAAMVAALAWALLLAPVAGPAAVGGLHTGAHDAVPLVAGAVGWVVTATAMMVPSTLPVLRELALGAPWSRRGRTVAIFLTTYLGIWAMFGAVAYGVVEVAEASLRISASALLPAGLAVAGLWELTRWKWRATRMCHLIRPLPPRGLKADAACAAAALRYGRRCLEACWAVMFAMTVAGHANLGLMVLLTALVAAGKLAARPARLAVPLAAILAYAALISMAG
jgi:predicted metal-binding membrane protein